MTDKPTDWQLIEQIGTEAADRAKWRAVLERNANREYPLSTGQALKRKADKASRAGRTDDVLSFLQYCALTAAIIFTLAACAGFLI